MFPALLYLPIVALAFVFMAWAITRYMAEDAYRKAHPNRRGRR